MTTATVSSQGRITIPVDVRLALKVGAGDQVEFVQTGPTRFEIIAATRSVRELKGMFDKPHRRVPIEEMSHGAGCIDNMAPNVPASGAAGKSQRR